MRKQIADRVGARRSAEVDAKRKNQLNETRASLAELKDRPPQQIGEHNADEVKILPKFHDKVIAQIAVELMVDGSVGENCGGKEEHDRSLPHIVANLHFTEHRLIEADDDPEHQDRKKAVAVVVVVSVGRRQRSVAPLAEI